MLTERLKTSGNSFFEKLLSVDYFLILIVLSIGAISVFAIYSTESGNFSYFTKNHLIFNYFFELRISDSLIIHRIVNRANIENRADDSEETIKKTKGFPRAYVEKKKVL